MNIIAAAILKNRRILSLWFPRLGAERILRLEQDVMEAPLAVARDTGNMQVLSSLSASAERAGLHRGQPLRDAYALCPALLVRPADPTREAAFLTALRRWAGRFSPWIADQPPDGLIADLTGCAHLFGGEESLLAQMQADCSDFGLTVCAGLADTPGAAWALARFPGRALPVASQQKAFRLKRRPRPAQSDAAQPRCNIAPAGQTRQALAPLPVAALRLPENDVLTLGRLGLRNIGDLAGQPRATLARRFGRRVVQRLDQALGADPEPITPAAPEVRFALRLTLPDPIGLEADVAAGVDRLLPRLGEKLEHAGRGARVVQLQALRCDHRTEIVEVGLARPSSDPDRIRPLLALKLGDIDAGPGIDCLRLLAPLTEAVQPRQPRSRIVGDTGAQEASAALDDLLGRLGARVGMEALTRQHPADSHIPEKSALVLAAAWSEPAADWPVPATARPALIWRPEPVHCHDAPRPPDRFRWRQRTHTWRDAQGPERISPEWWLDDPDWRSGLRDYWVVTTGRGERLWVFYAHGGEASGGWFCQGAFA